jgi:mono/diheme cytochrome c family protein
MPTFADIVLAVEEAGPVSPSNANWGQLALIVVAGAVLVWLIYLFVASRRGTTPEPEETPKNLQPYLSDDELENSRLTRVLGAAVVAAAVLAITLPVYYVGESRRQADAAEEFAEKDVEEGEHWYEFFSCINCHGPGGVGGGAGFIEARSNLETSWAAPSIDDVLYRYSEDEVEYWLNYGRSGTPMPPVGLVGGGAATIQEVDQLLAYLRSIQIPQSEAVAEVENLVDQALNRMAGADAAVSQLIREQQAVIDDILDADVQFEIVGNLPVEIRSLMAEAGICTDDSAAAVGAACANPGPDRDRDGLSDELEILLTGPDNAFAAVAADTVRIRSVAASDATVEYDDAGAAVYEAELDPNPAYPSIYELSLSPLDAFTMTDVAGEPVPDLESLDTFLTDLDTAVLTLGVTSERQDVFVANARQGYDFLVEALENRYWAVDFDRVASDSGLSLADGERAVGLFNAYCARCHTAGYSAGVAFEQPAGSGAWAPSLTDGRSVVQFPDVEDQVGFIIRGSNLAESYGVNGLGRGWMPGFGQILTEDDIRLIIAYERSM